MVRMAWQTETKRDFYGSKLSQAAVVPRTLFSAFLVFEAKFMNLNQGEVNE